jgi:hypothetical protein
MYVGGVPEKDAHRNPSANSSRITIMMIITKPLVSLIIKGFPMDIDANFVTLSICLDHMNNMSVGYVT